MSTTPSQHHTQSASQTRDLAADVAQQCRSGDLVALDGELGAGKTTFVQGFVAALPNGLRAQVSSPTFALLNEYPTRPPVFHYDFYRLHDLDDLETTGFWDVVGAARGIILVEWANRLPEACQGAIRIRIRTLASNQRRIEIDFPDDRAISSAAGRGTDSE